MAADIGEIGAGARTGKRRIADEARKGERETEVIAEREVVAKTEIAEKGGNLVAQKGAIAMKVERMVGVQVVVLAKRDLGNVAGREVSVRSAPRKAGERTQWHLLQNPTRNMKLRKVRLTTLDLQQPMFLLHRLLHRLLHHLPHPLPCLLNLLLHRKLKKKKRRHPQQSILLPNSNLCHPPPQKLDFFFFPNFRFLE